MHICIMYAACVCLIKGPVILLKYDSRLIYFYTGKNTVMDHVLLFVFHIFCLFIVATGRN
jgi:hypothetical protein